MITMACAIIAAGSALYMALLARKMALRFEEVCGMAVKRFSLDSAPRGAVPMGRLTARERMARAARVIADLRQREQGIQ